MARNLLILAVLFCVFEGNAQGTAFNYNGRLTDGNVPANGNYDVAFRVFDSPSDGSATSLGITNRSVAVSNGVFTVSLDFGPDVFNGEARWIELKVRTNGVGSFTTLAPRQELKPVPYAIHAASASSVTGPLGTTTSQPLEFQVNNRAVLRLENNSTLPPNLIGGPIDNSVASDVYGAFIGSGAGNTLLAGSYYSSIVGGNLNSIEADSSYSVVGGGYYNIIGGTVNHGVIGGGNDNRIVSGSVSTIGGGWGNRVQGGWATIGGGSGNILEGDGATISGGAGNQIKVGIASIGGGSGNVIDGAMASSISGGNDNRIVSNSAGAHVGGGYGNSISNAGFGVISGGNANELTGNAAGSVISGGNGNVADSPYATIAGGEYNRVEGIGGYATVVGGRSNKASGAASLAAGYLAHATNNGSFIWNAWTGDEASFGSIADSEFAVRAPGGIRFYARDQAGNSGNMILDAGDGLFNLTAREGATLNFYTNGVNVFSGGINFNTGGQGVFVDGERVGSSGGGSGGIANGSVTTEKLADGSVTATKLSITGTAGAGKFLSYSGGSLAWAESSGSGTGGWSLNGNAGTTSGNFLGTLDNVPFEIRVNNVGGVRFVPNQESINIIAGASGNRISATVKGATVSGGGMDVDSPDGFNEVRTDFGTISGGTKNLVLPNARSATIGGGEFNEIGTDSTYATINGGYGNKIADALGTIGGGQNNKIEPGAMASTISGGFANEIEDNGTLSTIAGGYANVINNNASYTIIGGGNRNLVSANFAGVLAGIVNTIQVQATSSVIAGGTNNTVQNFSMHSAIGGGMQNTIESVALSSTISGGERNTNQSLAFASTIGGGFRNTILTNGQYATIPGGFNNKATNRAFAAGSFAHAVHAGSFVWSDFDDGAEIFPFLSTAKNQFAVRANGGALIQGRGGFGNPQLQLIQTANDFTRFRMSNPSSSWDISAGTDGSLRFFSNDSDRMIINNGGLTVNGTFVSSSDRNVKENFETVDSEQILAKVVALPITQWNYKSDKSAKHIGPMAQDFHAAFKVGPDERHIAVVDESGVALAAIQGLNQKLETEAKDKDAEIEQLKERLEDLEKLVKSLAGKP